MSTSLYCYSRDLFELETDGIFFAQVSMDNGERALSLARGKAGIYK